MRRSVTILIIISALFFFGCSNKAAEMFETAKFEELQNNKEHATELYEEIIKKYLNSEQTKKSKERLAELRKKE